MMSLNGLPLRVFLYTRNVDMRKSFNGMHAIVQSEFKMDVLPGDTFLFLSKRRDRVKAMWWDIDGLAIYMKRLEAGHIRGRLSVPMAAMRSSIERNYNSPSAKI